VTADHLQLMLDAALGAPPMQVSARHMIG